MTVLTSMLLLSLSVSLSLSFSAMAAAKPHFSKVITIVFENTDYTNAMKNPTLSKLASQGVLFDNFSGVTHPSQGNYIAMIAGNSFSIHNDANINLNENHIGDLLEKNNMTWRIYAEDFPGNCFSGASKGKYYRKHVPFLSFTNVTKDPVRCANVVDTSTLATDLASMNLPNYTMIVPNIVNDGHDGGPTAIQRWIQKSLSPFLANPKNLEDTLVVLTFDEADSLLSNHVYTVFLGAGLAPQTINHQGLNHIDVLGLIEKEWDLGTLPQQLKTTEIKNLWRN